MSKRIVIAGASGLIGASLTTALRERGDTVISLVRRAPASPLEAQWEPSHGGLDPQVLAGADAVVVLNGASIGKLPWTEAYRQELISSRVNPVATVALALSKLASGAAPMLVSASAVGFYGDQPGVVLDESGAPGQTFLARLCQRWEEQALQAQDFAPVALLRTAPVVDTGAFLRPLIALTKLGLAGPLAGGAQVWPWISLSDEVNAIIHVIDHRLTGPVNLCGPTPVTANAIGREVAKQLRRPFWLPAPALGLRLVLGHDAAQCLLLADADVRPTALEDAGFVFEHRTVAQAIEAALN
ncbi:MAG: TIGR01777 family oxidoreductase [Buchananella hordeovulneris]|nr:TIGR01777 family oxidoreductase [Buchananella hordeovulneris]